MILCTSWGGGLILESRPSIWRWAVGAGAGRRVSRASIYRVGGMYGS